MILSRALFSITPVFKSSNLNSTRYKVFTKIVFKNILSLELTSLFVADVILSLDQLSAIQMSFMVGSAMALFPFIYELETYSTKTDK